MKRALVFVALLATASCVAEEDAYMDQSDSSSVGWWDLGENIWYAEIHTPDGSFVRCVQVTDSGGGMDCEWDEPPDVEELEDEEDIYP
jgi:hypothetical protein